jgi:hypothetical protein
MLRAYVAGPFRGANHWTIAENIRSAERIALECWRLGLATYCPHTNTAHFQGAAPDEVWLAGHLEWLRQSHVVIVCPEGERSSGTVAEVKEAIRLGIPVFWAKNPKDVGAARRIAAVNEDPRTCFYQPADADWNLSDWIVGQKG